MHKQLSDKLAAMCGKTFVYKAEAIKVQAARVNCDTVEIATPGEWITFPVKSAPEELNKFAPFNAVERAPVELVVSKNGALEQLRNTVLDSIEKLKANKEYVPQAQAINESIKTLLEMGKLELQAAHLMREMGEDNGR